MFLNDFIFSQFEGFFERETYLKVRYKVIILPTKLRKCSSADSLLGEFRRGEKCEQILEFIMNEETICLTSILQFLIETDLENLSTTRKVSKNSSRIVGL